MEKELTEDEKRLLEAIHRVAQEREPLSDPRWDALARGALSATDEEALREEAKRSPTMAEAYEAFRPFDTREREAMIRSLPGLRSAPPKARRSRPVWALLA